MSDAAAETATETTEPATEVTTETAEDQLAKAQAEAEKWQKLSRKNEERAKANSAAATELEELRRKGMTELEAAVDQARTETRASVLAEFGSKLAGAEIRAAATGRVADLDAFLEGVDAAKFLDAEGNPDRAAIAAWIDTSLPKADEGFADLGQGVRGGDRMALNGDPLEQALKDKLGIR